MTEPGVDGKPVSQCRHCQGQEEAQKPPGSRLAHGALGELNTLFLHELHVGSTAL